MIFDVGIRLGFNAAGKAMNYYYRVRDVDLSACVRKTQDKGQYVFSVIPLFPLFRPKRDAMGRIIDPVDTEAVDDFEKPIDPIDSRSMIDSQGM